jgi:hypothetical protein
MAGNLVVRETLVKLRQDRKPAEKLNQRGILIQSCTKVSGKLYSSKGRMSTENLSQGMA